MSQPLPESNPIKNIEYRSGVELRAEGSRIVGHAIVFDVRSRDLGGFTEVVRPQAVDRSLTGDIVALYNHDPAAVLGRTPKTLTVRKDDRGLAFELEPALTQAGRDAITLVHRGDVRGASFGFRTIKDVWTREGTTNIRTLIDIEILELSLSAFPSYQQTDVTIALRSLQAARTGIDSTHKDLIPPHKEMISPHSKKSPIAWLRLQERTR